MLYLKKTGVIDTKNPNKGIYQYEASTLSNHQNLFKNMNTPKIFTLLIFLLINSLLFAQDNTESEDKTLSPYFFIPDGDPMNDQMPLLSTDVQVNIAGVVADVCVKQVYKNDGQRPIEAIYTFPASTRAAVYGMKMTIGKRILVAEIQEKQQARQTYETAKKEGKRASLLEQQRPNVFQMNVANIIPGDVIEVELSYTELLIPENGVYEFVYPTVVGPRYNNTPKTQARENEQFVENPYLEAREKPKSTLTLQTNIQAGLPISEVGSTSHKIQANYQGLDKVNIILDEKYGGNRDFILQYELKGKQIESGLLLVEGQQENYFMLMMQPPKRVETKDIPPRDYVFIIDISGSMRGYPLDISKKLMQDLIGNLRPEDKFNVLLFAGSNEVFAEQSISATPANLQKAISWLNGSRGGGGTELLSAMNRALSLPKTDGYSRSFVIATDGYVTVEKETFDLIRNKLDEANIFAFGIGSSVNRHIIEGMAYMGQGEPFIVTKQKQAPEKAEQLRQYISTPVLTDIDLQYKGLDVYDVSQQSIPDLFANRPVVIYGKYKGKANGEITLKGKRGKQKYTQTINVAKVSADAENGALRYLWARDRIRTLNDYNGLQMNEDTKKEITNLGINYNLLTEYTSFVAVDKQVVNKDGKTTTVKQPLPMPEGVSNDAIGYSNNAHAMPKKHAYAQNYTTSKPVPSLKRRAFSSPASAPPPPPPTMSLEVVEDTDIDEIEEMPGIAIVEEKEQTEEAEIFTIVEVMPQYPGGQKALHKFIKKHLTYPATAKANGVQGTVYIGFVIDEYGNIQNVTVKRGLADAKLNAEALRIVNLMPRWIPGTQRGKAVKVKFTLPIKFKL